MSDGVQTLATPRVSGSGGCRSHFSVGGVAVRLTGDDSAAVALVPSLMAFRAEPGQPDIRVRVEWIDKLSAAPGAQLFDSGALWRLYECEAGFQFDFCAPVFGEQPYKRLLVDRDFSRATLQMSAEVSAAFPYAAPLGYPVDELLIMHRLTREKAIELHSCGIVREDGTGNLFVGHSGAGKSTTTRLWMEREDVEILSDDRMIVRRDSAADDKAKTGMMRMYGTPWHGEAAYASPESARLARIFILEHGRGNVLTRLSPSQAVAELFARSFVPFHRHEYVESALEFLQELVGAVPCYRYAFEPNEGAVERILELRD
ncbi:MAG: hypothetical protein ACLPHP_19165 [Candidatus Sulfotelmatobacter sp.]